MNNDYILKLEQVSKSFPGVKALDTVDFAVKRGTVHALVGENGAGKSTLIKILAGIYQMSSGRMFFDAKPVVFRAPHDSQLAGISVVHQELKLSEPLSVTENIFLGNLIYKNKYFVDWLAMKEKAAKILKTLKGDIAVDQPVSNLPVAKKQIVEIAKAINQNCKVLVMDEPSAVLTEPEQKNVFEIVKQLRSKGITIIYISHRLEEIFELADEVTVLRDGKKITTLPIAEVDRTSLVTLMVGRELKNEYPVRNCIKGETVLEVKNLNRAGILHNINFTAKRGELLAFAGLVGSGRTEIARAILGIDSIDSGEIKIRGKIVRNKNFREAIKNGFGLIPEDRKSQGLVLSASISDNVCMANIDKILRRGIIQSELEDKYCDEYIKRLRIATPSRRNEVQYLSGGNQQKVVIAKWLMRDSEIIFFDEPTRGVDVGAKVEIYNLINTLVAEGKIVIMISSELPEILGMSDRILVIHDGEIVGELTKGEATQEQILSLCV